VNHCKIDTRNDNLTGFGRLAVCVLAKYFLGDGVAHRMSSRGNPPQTRLSSRTGEF